MLIRTRIGHPSSPRPFLTIQHNYLLWIGFLCSLRSPNLLLHFMLKALQSFALRLKPLHWGYNMFNRKRLINSPESYRRFGLKRPLWYSINAEAFKESKDNDWTYAPNQEDLAKIEDSRLVGITESYRSSILAWEENGFLVLPGFLNDVDAETINEEIDRLLSSETVGFNRFGNRIMFALKHSKKVKSIIDQSRLSPLMELLMGKPIELFQTINFLRGSEQGTHSDSLHMSTHPRGGLIAAWIALEDITEENGPLHYYPGSHKLPYLTNKDFGNEGNALMLGNKKYSDYTEKVHEQINRADLQKKVFTPKKGDLFIWHANLLHGGEPIGNPASSRKSMVLHYFAKDVICYHEISQRPTLKML